MAKARKPTLTIDAVQVEAASFAAVESVYPEPSLYGVTDGKAVGTYLEQKFRAFLQQKYTFSLGSSAKGIDFPELDLDVKFTSVRQPQSSCPFMEARQKVYGLGYSLLVFVYEKTDDPKARTATMKMLHTIFIEKHRTADYQTTRGLLEILQCSGNKDNVVAFLIERNLPIDEIGSDQLADEILRSPPQQGYLTMSNALQWRLQYGRVIESAGKVEGILRVV